VNAFAPGPAAANTPPMRLGVIAHQRSDANLGLAAARVPGVEVELLRPAQALLRLARGDVAVGRLDVLRSVDGVEPGFWALGELERRGVTVLNTAVALSNCHDKLATARALEAAGLPHPRTALLAHGFPLPDLTTPIVVKPRLGSWGRDVVLCASDGELQAHLAAIRRKLWFVSTGAVVQELVPPAGHDLRVLVACGQVLGAVRRVAAPGEWRTNVALGARRIPIEAPAEAAELALAAAEALGADLVGVDLLPDGDGWTILEVNGAVDFAPEYRPADDVFAAVVDAIARSVHAHAAVAAA
jgi:[lysine-biosynthesis-protein LysW]--L-2-aminoadipate ligase